MSDFLFSYGTLLPEYAPGEISGTIAKLTAYASGWVRGVLYDLGDYPGAVLDPASSSKVFGTILHLPANTTVWDELDAYEGFDATNPSASLFIRKRCPVVLANGPTIECWIYEYNGERNRSLIITTGRYRPQQSAPSQ